MAEWASDTSCQKCWSMMRGVRQAKLKRPSNMMRGVRHAKAEMAEYNFQSYCFAKVGVNHYCLPLYFYEVQLIILHLI
jgi:hypothetical protein